MDRSCSYSSSWFSSLTLLILGMKSGLASTRIHSLKPGWPVRRLFLELFRFSGIRLSACLLDILLSCKRNAIMCFIGYIICCNSVFCRGTDILVMVRIFALWLSHVSGSLFSSFVGDTFRFSQMQGSKKGFEWIIFGPRDTDFYHLTTNVSETISRSIACQAELSSTSARRELSKNVSYGAVAPQASPL